MTITLFDKGRIHVSIQIFSICLAYIDYCLVLFGLLDAYFGTCKTGFIHHKFCPVSTIFITSFVRVKYANAGAGRGQRLNKFALFFFKRTIINVLYFSSGVLQTLRCLYICIITITIIIMYTSINIFIKKTYDRAADAANV